MSTIYHRKDISLFWKIKQFDIVRIQVMYMYIECEQFWDYTSIETNERINFS